MELNDAISARRMVRSFAGRPVPREVLARILAATRAAPSAGNTRGTAWLALEGPEQTGRYWDHATTAEWRARSARWPGLSRAPVVLLSLASPDAYVARYAEADKVEADKVGTGATLGEAPERWPVPYWFGDAAFETMLVLLRTAEEGLGACFLGAFRGEQAVLGACGVPSGWRLFGAIALGHPDGQDHRSASLDRPVPAVGADPHFGSW